jgi:hypothetical protein
MQETNNPRLYHNALFIGFYLLIHLGLGFQITIICMLAHILSELNLIYKKL